MDRRTEQEYKQALDSLRYSSEGKERIMKKLMERQEQRPEKRKSIRPLRTVLIAAAVCAALVMTAGAAVVSVRQTKTVYVDSREELWRLEYESDYDEGERTERRGYVYDGREYRSAAVDTDDWFNVYGEETPDEEIIGTEADGWTKMRTYSFESNWGSNMKSCYVQKRYLADRLSGFDSLWMSTPWDTAWVEEHYTAVPNSMISCTSVEQTNFMGTVTTFCAAGEFQGENGALFQISVNKMMAPNNDTIYWLTEGYDYTELYQTKDGVEVTVLMATSASGKPRCWAEFDAGYYSFDLDGVYLELDELHDILDSLNLSVLLENPPEP